MDKQQLETIIKTSDKLAVLKRQKYIAKEKFEANTILGYEGGLFKISPEFLVYLNYLLMSGRTKETVIVDHNLNPIMIKSVVDFQSQCQDRYFHALDVFYTDHQEFETLNKSELHYLKEVGSGKF